MRIGLDKHLDQTLDEQHLGHWEGVLSLYNVCFHQCIVGAVLILMPLTGVASAQSDCRSIENELDRLACYDRESGRTPAAESIPTTSAWKVKVEKSEMTDDTTVIMTVDADDPVACMFSNTETPTLVVRCLEDTTSVYIATTGCYLVSSEYNSYGDVMYRIDDEPAKTRGFESSTSNRALGLWSGGASIPFVKSLFGHNELLTRFTPFNENSVTARFQIAGLEEAAAPLRAACGW